MDGGVLYHPSYGVYISLHIRFARVCSHVDDFNACNKCFFFGFGLMLNVPVNNFSVMLGRSHRFLGITSTFWGKYVLLKDTTRRPEWGSNPRPLDSESEVLTTRPPRPLCNKWSTAKLLKQG